MADVYRVKSRMTGVTGTPYYSTQFFELVGGASALGAQEAAGKVEDFWSALTARIATAIDIDVEDTVDVLSETTGELLSSFQTSVTVTQPAATGDTLPPQDQGLLRILTGQIRNGRRVFGRIFVPGPVEIDNGAGVPSAAYVGALNTAAESLVSTAVNNQLCVWHRPVFDANGALIRAGEAIAASGTGGATYWAILRSRRD